MNLRATGTARSDLTIKHYRSVIQSNSLLKGGLKNSDLVTRGFITYFIPFLPLERKHVRKCIIMSLRKDDKIKNNFDKIQSLTERVSISKLKDIIPICFEFQVLYDIEFDPEYKMYSSYGCRRVESSINYERMSLNKKEL